MVPALIVVLAACSGVPPSETPTPSPTPTGTPVMPVPPTPTPTSTATIIDPTPPPPDPTDTATPVPTAEPWTEIETELVALDLRGTDLPLIDDGMGDGLDDTLQEPRNISPDLDLRRVFGGRATIDQPHFGPGGLFDCDDPLVMCGQRVPLGGADLLLVGLQTYGDIDLSIARNGQLAVVVDLDPNSGAPLGSGGFAGGDLIVITDLTNRNVFELLHDGQNFTSRPSAGRVRIDGDTALFALPINSAGGDDQIRVVTFERIPPNVGGGERVDVLPGLAAPVAESFFDVFFEIEPAP